MYIIIFLQRVLA